MDNTKNQNKALMLGLITVMLWSTVATAFKLSLSLLTPIQLVSLAAVVSTVALTAGSWLNEKLQQVPRIIRQKPLLYFTLGALNPAAYYLALFAGYDLLPAQVASPVNYSWVWKAATKTAQVTSLMFLSPVLSLALINTILAETIHFSVIPGVSLILGGMAVQQWCS
ncbi:DMT family transporter [Sansalvadorimonas sp. 2012CJ34-2]|uniref:DMT family transporter n=1 Tax=Parendozoicomonas callyspongiae TaxID=2942213 RepID=A0ABT0PCG0_9GAMM|nr:DMT family transporter [Sansalvadorimonas sp. 2012CJ34-2]MCL6269067.1 DMT family transporter [Sansalvadorimonas sp. 2012CJ34-2]